MTDRADANRVAVVGVAPEGVAAEPETGARSVPAPDLAAAAAPRNSTVEAARRAAESVVVAIVTSTGLYLVGWVYVDAYYGRMSVEVTSLDLAPPYVALQAVHALPRLLEYPSTLLLFWVLWRTFAGPARRRRGRLGPAAGRFPRLAPIIANAVVVAPLVASAAALAFRQEALVAASVLGEVVDVLGSAAFVLLAYAVWLGWSQRRFLVDEVRAHRPLPIALGFAVYLLSALASTAIVGGQAAELLVSGEADGALRVEFVGGSRTPSELVGKDLVLVMVRGGVFYAVEQEPFPPGPRPVAYAVPAGAIDGARTRRIKDANAGVIEILIGPGE